MHFSKVNFDYFCSMKRWASYVFIFIFTSNAMAIAVMGVWYINNQSYFTDNFCVNKEKIEMQCKGRCHLQKQISGQTEKQDKQEISIPVLEFEYTTYSISFTTKRVFSIYIAHNFVESSNFYTAPYLSNEYQPPIG